MHIIIEGADATGKSTLATKLSKITGYPIVGSAGPPQTPEEMVGRVDHYLRLNTPHIFDRHPCVSDLIYGQFRGGSPIRYPQISAFYKQRNFFIFTPYLGGLQHEERSIDTPEHLDLISKNHSAIIQRYAEWAFEHAHIIYRYTEADDWEHILPALRGKDFFQDITDFHTKFELTYEGRPRELPDDLAEFRMKFLVEEVKEYTEAHSRRNLTDMLDALVDITYVTLGTAYLHGFNFPEAWRRVHEANMRKVRAQTESDSKRGSTHDVVKPAGWNAPDLEDLTETWVGHNEVG